MVEKVQSLLNEKKYMEAVKLARNTAESAKKSLLKLKPALKKEEPEDMEEDIDEKLKTLIELIKRGEKVKVDVKRAKKLMIDARVALKENETGKARDLLNLCHVARAPGRDA